MLTKRFLRWRILWVPVLLLLVGNAKAQTLDEPFDMPTMTDTSTLDVVVVEDWHVDTID